MRVLCLAIVVTLVGMNVAAEGQSNGVREVSASGRTLIPLTTKLRYTTMILLPDQEEILDVVCGDRDYWVISATQNIAHVKPAKEGAATNLIPRQQLLLKRPDVTKVLSLNVDPKSYWIYTNTPLDNERVAAIVQKYGFEAGLDRLAASA